MPTSLDQMPHMPSQMDVGSGINTRKMVQDLVEAERAPTEKRLDRREEEIKEQISALGKMSSTLSGFKESLGGLSDPDSYSGIEASSSNTSVVQINAQEGAPTGDYDIQVEQLAREQRIATASGTFEDSSDSIGTGRLIIANGQGQGQEQTVRVEEEQSTLLGIRDAINEQTKGLRASVVDDGEGPRLAITSQETGQQNAIQQIRAEQINTETEQDKEDKGNLEVLQFGAKEENQESQEDRENRTSQQSVGAFEQVQSAADARVTIDGMQVTRSSNTIEGAIEGVTLELGEEGGSRIAISEQTGLIEKNIQSLVDSYNKVRSQLNKLSEYDAEAETAAPLQGDSTLNNVQSRLSRAITGPVEALANEPLRALGDLGVRTNRTGTLEVESSQLQSMASEHPKLVTDLMTNSENGVMARVEGVLKEVVGRDGVISMRTEGLESRLERIDEDRQRLDERMERREEQLRDQFSRMDERIAELNQTSDFIKQRLGAMNKGD